MKSAEFKNLKLPNFVIFFYLLKGRKFKMVSKYCIYLIFIFLRAYILQKGILLNLIHN